MPFSILRVCVNLDLYSFLSFCLHGVLKARILNWFTIPFSSGQHSVRYDRNQIPYDYTVKVTNRVNGLDLIDGVPEELWREVCEIVQEAVNKAIPKKCKKAKWLSEEALQIAMKRREAKSKDMENKIEIIRNNNHHRSFNIQTHEIPKNGSEKTKLLIGYSRKTFSFQIKRSN